MKRPLATLSLAAFTAACVAGASQAQVRRDAGGADPNAPGPYAGAPKEAFYTVEDRLAAAQRRAAGDRRAQAELRSIRAFAAQQKARHRGELRDWDREVIAQRLERLERSLRRG